jgi:hypothetical protein
MRVCREQRTYARHTVEMRLDKDRGSLAASGRYDSKLLCCISYFHLCTSSFRSTGSDLDPIACRKL